MVNVYEDIVKEAKVELLKNQETIESIYDNYVSAILRSTEKNGKRKGRSYQEKAQHFRIKKHLNKYSSISYIKSGEYDIRFAGKSIGTVRVSVKKSKTEKNKIVYEPKLTVTEQQVINAKSLGYTDSVEFTSASWNDKRCVGFRKYFNNKTSDGSLNIATKEHRIEQFLLNQFAEKSGNKKILPYIQPVRLGGLFFQFTTPFAACKHQPKLSIEKQTDKNGNISYKATGGGIDILARVRHKGESRSRFAVIELKDENKPDENQSLVIQQALIYATFIAFLFRSKRGKDWWNIFFEKEDALQDVPDEINIDVVSLMPIGETPTEECPIKTISIHEFNTILNIYSLYYDVDDTSKNPCGINSKSTYPQHLRSYKP